MSTARLQDRRPPGFDGMSDAVSAKLSTIRRAAALTGFSCSNDVAVSGVE